MNTPPAQPRHDRPEPAPGLAEIADIVTPFAVRAAATLRLADHIAAGHTELPDLAEAAGAEPRALCRLLRFLTCRDIFAEPEPGTYALTGLAEELLCDHPANLRQWLDADEVAGRLDATFPHLVEAVRSGTSVYAKVHGAPFWEDLGASPARTASFDRLMAQVSPSTSGIGTAYDWSGVRHLVDVGGGTGALLREVLEAHPHLRGTVADQAGSVAEARRHLAAHGLDGRADAAACDMFAVVPPGGDAYLLSRVLADWDDERAVRILHTCAAALTGQGRVLVAERVLPHPPAPDAPDGGDPSEIRRLTSHDLRMLVLLGGRKRSTADYAHLAERAGLDLHASHRLPGGATVMEFHPATRDQRAAAGTAEPPLHTPSPD
ncbi:methyltransferase [Streptomyces albulus]|uniref:methyltransferase n=1 Tax=Streptomyces noursei TaxID=1971 RepID=UPI001F30774C|nr:methyltransferase [Streptomyces noursei]MCE4948129.1 methyltransferase [Streptomyces noursei]